MRVALLGLPLACAALAWAACSEFDSASAPADASTEAPPNVTDGGPSDDGGGGAEAGPDGVAPGVASHLPACPRPAGPACVPSACPQRILYQPATQGTEFPFAIAMDSSFVYWTTISNELNDDAAYDGRGTAKIMRTDRLDIGHTAKAPATVLAKSQRSARSLVIAGDYLYWVAMNLSNKAQVRRVRRDCASSCTVEDVILLGSESVGELVALDDATLFAADDGGTVYAVSIGPTAIRVSTVISYFPTVTAGRDAGFAAGLETPDIKIVPLTSFVPVTYGKVPDAAADSGLAVGMSPIISDCTDIYGTRGGSEMWKLPGGGGNAVSFKTLAAAGVYSMAADQSWIYVGAPNAGGVFAVPKGSGIEQQVKSGNIHRVAVDDVGVYWGDHDRAMGGALWMMAKSP